MPLAIPTTPHDITPDWLTAVLRRSTTITQARVAAATVVRIGVDESFTGGGLYRIVLTYTPPDPAAPSSLVAKLSPLDPEMNAIMRISNGREVGFYLSVQDDRDLPVPRCYHADVNADTGASVLLLQDLSHFRATAFIKGCGPAAAKRVIEALAVLHAHWWNKPALAPLSGADIVREFPFAKHWADYPAKVRSLLPEIEIPLSFLKLGDHIARNEAAIFEPLMERAPLTRLHRDVQADNVMFGPVKGKVCAKIFDWQLSGKGRGVYDVAYFLISSVEPAQRRNMERALVAHYHDQLLRLGVADYSLADCWSDYVQSVLGKILITVAATVLLDNSSQHKTAWRGADLKRLLAFCSDHHITAQTFSQ